VEFEVEFIWGEQYGIDYPRFSNVFLQMTTADPSYKYNRLN